VLTREQEIARAHLAAGEKDRALLALRRRKYQQSLLTKTDGQLQTLEELVCSDCHLYRLCGTQRLTTPWQVSTIEFSLVEVSVLHGLKQGNDVLKEIHKEMNIDSVEKLLEETAEAQAYQRVRSLQ
jgi:charged multivesicular body protein 6